MADPSFQLQLTQKLALAPQLQQAIKLLQLTRIELREYIQEVLDSNPILERGEAEPEPGAAAEEQTDPTSGAEGAADEGLSDWDYTEVVAGLDDPALGAGPRLPVGREELEQTAGLAVEEAPLEEVDHRVGALPKQGLRTRLVEREKRLEQVHVRILAPRTALGPFEVVLRDLAADRYPALQVEARQRGIQDLAADVVEIDVDPFGAVLVDRGRIVIGLPVVESGIEA